MCVCVYVYVSERVCVVFVIERECVLEIMQHNAIGAQSLNKRDISPQSLIVMHNVYAAKQH